MLKILCNKHWLPSTYQLRMWNLIRHCWRRMPTNEPLFPLGVNDTLQTNIFAAQTLPSMLKHFTLIQGFILSTNLTPPHWMVLLVFARGEDRSQKYAFMVERVLAGPLSRRAITQSSQISGQLSHPTTPQAVKVRIKGNRWRIEGAMSNLYVFC